MKYHFAWIKGALKRHVIKLLFMHASPAYGILWYAMCMVPLRPLLLDPSYVNTRLKIEINLDFAVKCGDVYGYAAVPFFVLFVHEF